MVHKRTFFDLTIDASDAEHDSPPTKRRLTSVPRTPFPTRTRKSLPAAPANNSSPLRGTPYPSRPLDSPTNPVGRKHTRNLAHSLPPRLKLTEDLSLRFQFVRPGVSPRMGGIYRIVQVPSNYTFVHLRCLIAFLFGGGVGDEREDRHLFEAKKKVNLYPPTYKPGEIRSGFTAVKLSTARDPCRYKPEGDMDYLLDDDVHTEEVLSDPEDSGETDPTWKWELEEEHTLSHLWFKGSKANETMGIIYHHNDNTAVHITYHKEPLPKRPDRSNTPRVFTARGRVRLYPNSVLPLPKPVFSIPIRKLSVSPVRKSHQLTSSDSEADAEGDDDDDENSDNASDPGSEDLDESDGESDPETGDARSSGFLTMESESHTKQYSDDEDNDEDEDEDESENPNIFLGLKKFNARHAFATYLRFVYEHNQRPQYPLSDTSDDEDNNDLFYDRSTPALVQTSSSPISSSPLRSSSVALASSPSSNILFKRPRLSLPSHAYNSSLSSLSTIPSMMPTPAPAHAAWQVRRIQRIEKRMEKHKRRVSTKADSDKEEDNVDQLAEDQNHQESTMPPPPAKKKLPFPPVAVWQEKSKCPVNYAKILLDPDSEEEV